MSELKLNRTEINLILEEIKKPEYSRTNLLHLGKNKLSIRDNSKKTDLILIYGNDHFGYKHIVDRHSLYSKKGYWKENEKLENQSRFHSYLPPMDYIWLAEKIYKEENKNFAKNKKPESFDMYTAKFGNQNVPETEYTLITYKNTGIIHTLFVSENKKPFNKKKILDFQEGGVSTTHDLINEIQTHTKPYFDKEGNKRFIIVLRVYEKTFIEKWFVQINSKEGKPIKTVFLEENKVSEYFKAAFRRGALENEPLTEIERKIKKHLQGNGS